MIMVIERLRQISRICLAGEGLSATDAKWLAERLESFLSHNVKSMDDAFGLKFARGGVPWWREEAMRKRDAALRDLAESFLSAHCKTAMARHLYRLSLRYMGSAWRFDRDRDEMPFRYTGTPHEYLWLAFKSGAPMPIGERHLRTLLGDLSRSSVVDRSASSHV